MTNAKIKSPTSPQRRRSSQPDDAVENPPTSTPTATRKAHSPGALPVISKQGAKKEKRLRVSHRLTATQSALLDQLKSRSIRLGHSAKKGDVIFAGLQLLNKLTESRFEAVIVPLLNSPTFEKNPKGKKMVARKEK